MTRVFEAYLEKIEHAFWDSDGRMTDPTFVPEGLLYEVRDNVPDVYLYRVERKFERFLGLCLNKDMEKVLSEAENSGLSDDLDNPQFNLRNGTDFDPYRLWNPVAPKATFQEAVYEMNLEFLLTYATHLTGISEDEAQGLVDRMAAPQGDNDPRKHRIFEPGRYFGEVEVMPKLRNAA